MGSASGASQEFRLMEGKHSQKITQQRLLKNLENLHKILKISKKFKNFSKI